MAANFAGSLFGNVLSQSNENQQGPDFSNTFHGMTPSNPFSFTPALQGMQAGYSQQNGLDAQELGAANAAWAAAMFQSQSSLFPSSGAMVPHGGMWQGLQPQQPRSNRASEDMIDMLPTSTVTSEQVASAPEEHRCCVICMEEYSAGDELRTLPCFHRFHVACVSEWLRCNSACPICKTRVEPSTHDIDEDDI